MLLGFEGFDWADSSTDLIEQGGFFVAGSTYTTTRNGYGRSVRGSTRKSIGDQTGNTIILGVCIYNYTVVSSTHDILQFGYGSFSEQCVLALNSDRKLQFMVGSTVLGVGSITIPENTWYHIECKLLVNNGAGLFQCKVEGVLDIDLSVIDTQGQSVDTLDSYSLASTSTYYDDLVVMNTLGTTHNDFIGERIVRTNAPNADVQKQFTRSTNDGIDSNASALNESYGAAADPYVYSNTVGNKDIYSYPALTDVDTNIDGVKLFTFAGKTAGTPRVLAHGIKFGGNVQSENIVLGVGYGSHIKMVTTTDGSTPITKTDLDGINTQLEVVS